MEPPVFVFATLIDVLGLAPVLGFENPTPARKNVIMLPEVVIGVDRYSSPPQLLFKRLFDTAANAFGLPGSPFYNTEGKYIG